MNHDSRTAQIPSAGPTEESRTEIFVAPEDLVVANVVYTPARDVQGDWDRPRITQLRKGREDESDQRILADASVQSSDAFLPANVAQNAIIWWTNRVVIREGEPLSWTSHVLTDRPGIPDPGGTVEVVFEPVTETGSPQDLVPDYWQDKAMALQYWERPLGQPGPGGDPGVSTWDYDGTFVEATDKGIVLEVETPLSLGVSSNQYEFLYELVHELRLL